MLISALGLHVSKALVTLQHHFEGIGFWRPLYVYGAVSEHPHYFPLELRGIEPPLMTFLVKYQSIHQFAVGQLWTGEVGHGLREIPPRVQSHTRDLCRSAQSVAGIWV